MALSKHSVQPVDPLLTGFTVDYVNNQADYIADKVFATVPVANESGTYYTFTSTKDKFKDMGASIRRAPGATYVRDSLNIGTSTYQTQEDAVEIPVDKRIQNNALKPYDPEKDAAIQAAERVLIRRERRFVSAITNATTFASQTAAFTAAEQFNNDNSEPVSKVDALRETVAGNCGRLPNTIVFGWDVWLALKEHPAILDRIKTTNDQVLTIDLLARLFGVEPGRLYVMKSFYNTAEEGQTVSLARVMTDQMFMAYVSPRPSLTEPSVGYLIQKNGMQSMKYFEQQTNSTITRSGINEDMKVVAADCGYLSTDVLA